MKLVSNQTTTSLWSEGASLDRMLFLGAKNIENRRLRQTLVDHPHWKSVQFNQLEDLTRAFEEIAVLDYQLILVDCPSFSLSPIETLIQIRGRNKFAPIIMINKIGHEKAAISCLKHGADYYVLKEKGWIEGLPMVMEMVVEESRQKNGQKKMVQHLEEENRWLKETAILDQPTHFYSSKHFSSLLSRELKRATRYGESLTCLVMELDDKSGKKQNSGADRLQEELGLLLRSLVRSCDIWGRIEDGRFAALLPQTTLSQAKQAVKRIKIEIEAGSFTKGGHSLPLKTRWGAYPFDKKTTMDETTFLQKACATLR